MKCAACGNENQASAKFCVHCGVVLSATGAPARCVAACERCTGVSSGAGSRPGVFDGDRHAPCDAERSTVADRDRYARCGATVADGYRDTSRGAERSDTSCGGGVDTAASPAPESTRRLGLIGTAAALLIVPGVGGYFGYRMLGGGGEAKKTAVAAEARRAKRRRRQCRANQRRTPLRRLQPEVPPADRTGRTRVTEVVCDRHTAGRAAGRRRLHCTACPRSQGEAGRGAGCCAQGSESSAQGSGRRNRSRRIGQPIQRRPRRRRRRRWPSPPLQPRSLIAGSSTADAIAGCASEKFFARFMCEQKTRGRFCGRILGQSPAVPQAGRHRTAGSSRWHQLRCAAQRRVFSSNP